MSINPDLYDSIVCFGDSLVQQAEEKGFVAKLRTAYERKLDIIGRGFSGYTTRQGEAYLLLFFAGGLGAMLKHSASPVAKVLFPLVFTAASQRRPPKLVIIWFGTNDSIEAGNRQHIPLEETRSNLAWILSQLHASPVLLLTPGTVLEGVNEGHKNPATKQPYIDVIKSLASPAARDLHGHPDVSFVDMQQAFVTSPVPRDELLDADGLHIQPKGYVVVYEAVMGAIKDRWPHLDPSKHPYLFPHWTELDLAKDEAGQRAQLEPRRTRM